MAKALTTEPWQRYAIAYDDRLPCGTIKATSATRAVCCKHFSRLGWSIFRWGPRKFLYMDPTKPSDPGFDAFTAMLNRPRDRELARLCLTVSELTTFADCILPCPAAQAAIGRTRRVSCQRQVEMSASLPSRNVRFGSGLQVLNAGAPALARAVLMRFFWRSVSVLEAKRFRSRSACPAWMKARTESSRLFSTMAP